MDNIYSKKPEECAYSFTQHRACEFFPCHKTNYPEDFNCLFCYCPLYTLGSKCGGNFKYLENGVKDCSGCLLPHGRGSYSYIQHAGVFAANFSSNLLWQNCFAPKKSAFCAEPRRTAAGILDACQSGATTGLRETRLLRHMFSYARRPKARFFHCTILAPL